MEFHNQEKFTINSSPSLFLKLCAIISLR